jgi:hypothetical protein
MIKKMSVISILLAGFLSACASAAAPTAQPLIGQPLDSGSEGSGAAVTGIDKASGEVNADRAAEPSSGVAMGPAAPAPTASAGYGLGGAPAGAPALSDSGGGEEHSGSGSASDVAVLPAVPLGTAAAFPGVVSGGPAYLPPDQQFSALTAGEVDDNALFDAYLQYRLDYHKFLGYPVLDLDVSERQIVRVRTGSGQPVLGAQVTLYDGQTQVATVRTAATGLAYLFPKAYGVPDQVDRLNVVVQKDQASRSFTLTRSQSQGIWDVSLPVDAARPPVRLDVLFLIDSTGSMGDEIDQLKNNILSISAQISALPSQPDVHYGMVTYRDRGDEYIVRVADFTPDVQAFQQTLQYVQAGGGGDTPESFNEALYNAVHNVHWRVDNTVSLMFVVADAPPHLDYAQDYSYAQETLNAAAMGIKIHPIAPRLGGPEQDQAEYVFRQMAQITGGHFIFLTYADTPQSSGDPGTGSHVSEGSYSVEDLDALVVRLVQDELAALNGQQ